MEMRDGVNTNGTNLLNTDHKMCEETSNLVAEALRGDDCDLLAHTLVNLEVVSETRIVTFNNNASGFLDSLITNPTLRRKGKIKLSSINKEHRVTRFLCGKG